MTTFHTMRDALEYLYTSIDYEKHTHVTYDSDHYDLDFFHTLTAHLGSPHRYGHAIHIAGTKGKGSTAAILVSLLNALGYTTGLFTSPHLIDIRERIRIDGKAIGEGEFIHLAETVASALEELPAFRRRGYRTTFECLTAMAMLCFRRHDVQWSIYEVGMGGRLDCTNIIHPSACCITPIGLDHEESLGTTVSAIAREKGGIIKPSIPVISAGQTREVADILQHIATSRKAPLYFTGNLCQTRVDRISPSGFRFSIAFKDGCYDGLELFNTGYYQIENTATALNLLKILEKKGLLSIHPDGIRMGLRRLRWAGRLTAISPEHCPRIPLDTLLLVDGAHNPTGARKLVESIRKQYPDRKFQVILAIPSNKKADEIIEILSGIARRFITTRYDNPRASDPQRLEKIAGKYHPDVRSAPTLTAALDTANTADPILVTGSLYLAGELLALCGEHEHVLNILEEHP